MFSLRERIIRFRLTKVPSASLYNSSIAFIASRKGIGSSGIPNTAKLSQVNTRACVTLVGSRQSQLYIDKSDLVFRKPANSIAKLLSIRHTILAGSNQGCTTALLYISVK